MAIKINGNTVIDDSQAFTSTSTVSATGNITGGNLRTGGSISATGNITGGNIIGNVISTGPISTTGNVTGGNILTGGVVSATGNITGGNVSATNLTGTLLTAAQTNITSVGTLTSLNSGAISSSGNVTGANILTGGLISATGNVFGGNALFSGNLTVNGNVTYINSNVVTINDLAINLANNAANVAQTNNGGIELGPQGSPFVTFLYNSSSNAMVSSVGLSAVANVTGGNLVTGGLITATGNIQGGNLRTAGLISATGAITGAAISGTSLSASGNVDGGNIRTAGLISATGAITGAAITGTSLTVSTGNITGGNLLLSGAIIDSAQLDIQTSASNSNIALAPNGSGLVTVSTQLSAVGNVTGGNIRTAGLISATGTVTGSQFNGSGAGLTSIPNSALSNSSVTVNGTAIALGGSGTVTANAATLTGTTLNATVVSTSITSTGALNSGSITSGFGAIDIGTDTVTCGGIVNANANGVGNIGSSSTYFNTVFAKATSAQYADLAEKYTADADYEPGTVVMFGGSEEVTVCSADACRRVAGVISTNPSYIMNGTLESAHVATVALTGRVPCKVTGTVRKGDLMVSAGNGVARAEADPKVGTVIGKALADSEGDAVIEVVVGRF